MKKWDAYLVYLIFCGSTALFLQMFFAVGIYYWIDTVGLNPFQLVLAGTALELGIFFFEIPTGIVADVYSRRLSVIIGAMIMGIGIGLSAIPNLYMILLAQVILGIGFTFNSGALNAWITDELGEANIGKTFLRGAQVGQIVGLGAVVIGIGLAQLTITLPIVLAGILMLGLGVFLMLFMPENGFTPTPPETRNSWHSMKATFRDGIKAVRGRPVLMSLLLTTLIVGAFSEGYDRLWLAHLLDQFTLPEIDGLNPVIWVGMISMVGSILSIGAAEIVRRRVDTANHGVLAQALMLIIGMLMVGVLIFTVAGTLWLALGAIWLISVVRSMYEPLYITWINQGLDSKVRATVLSMSGQTDAAGQILGGPAIGLVANAFSMSVAMTISALMLAPVVLIFRLTMRQHRAEALVIEPEMA